MKFLEAMNDTSHEEHEEYVVWYGKVFDPDELDKIKLKFEGAFCLVQSIQPFDIARFSKSE